ncbi:MAG: response regulator [Thermoflexales bacterium]|nr:response regulator [Thermoflexales bacterium]
MEDKPHILVVEDDPSWQEIYAEALVDNGYLVKAAGALDAALSLLERQFFHVAIVDLKLGHEESNRDGLQVLRRIWELGETLAIVGSGYADVSMYDEFRKMGIFGLTQIPAEARQAFDSIDFYKGQIRKDESLQDILKKVGKAVAEAWPRSLRRRWSVSPFGIVQTSARDVQRALRAGSMTELRPFLVSLVQPLFPWLKARQAEQAIQADGATMAFETLCWSRAWGQAVVVRFGRRDSWQKSLELAPVGAAHGVAEQVDKDDAWQAASAHFEGIVRSVSTITDPKAFCDPSDRHP